MVNCYTTVGAAADEVQQASDADFGDLPEGDADRWEDLFGPLPGSYSAEPSDGAGSVGFEPESEPGPAKPSLPVPGVEIAVGPEASVHAGCQAGPGPFVEGGALGLAVGALTEREAAMISGFLRGLRESAGAADASTLDAIMRLLQVLPKPEGPRVLLNSLRHEQPALFERLHASMRRTQQRAAAANALPPGAAAGDAQ
mmetsp:Transcript_63305/g.181616  ORF Transcript_63305/g.181616 Transcript_63305/m.181616 type:complete len:199 (-) Transcript_63305:35-631(-)